MSRRTNIRTTNIHENTNLLTPLSNDSALIFRSYNSTGAFNKVFSFVDSTSTVTQISNTVNNNGTSDNVQSLMASSDGKAYFVADANGGAHYKVYNYDGSTVNYLANSQGNNTVDDQIAYNPVEFTGGRVCWNARNTTTDCKMFCTDGGTTTSQITDIHSGSCDTTTGYAPYNSKLYFYGRDSCSNVRLYVYDPSANAGAGGGTSALSRNSGVVGGCGGDDIASASTGYSPVVHNGKLFMSMLFAPLYGAGRTKLAALNPSGNTIRVVSNLNAAAPGDQPAYLKVYNSKLFFVALNSLGHSKLYSYDDTTNELRQLTDVTGSSNDDFTLNAGFPYDPMFTVYNNRLIFRMNNDDPTHVLKWYAYDDTTGYLYQITNMRSNAALPDSAWTDTVRPAVYGTRVGMKLYNANGVNKVFSLCDPGAGCTP